MKRLLAIMMIIVALVGVAQESQTLNLHFDQSKVSPLFNPSVPQAADLRLDYRFTTMSDSLMAYQPAWRDKPFSTMPRLRFDTNPYSRDWSSNGIITRLGPGYLTGAGAHTTYPGMGEVATASVAFSMPMGDRFQLTAGVTGSKYHFDRSAWNDYGIFGNASYRINDRLTLNAFGQYYINQRYHSVAVMPFLGSSSYGGTLGWRASDNFSLDVGARRLYDPYTGRWRTLPVVQPTINLLGAPISFDAGPLIYQLLDGLFGKSKSKGDWGDPRYRPVTVPGAVTSQPGFNPNSPVPIPDVFRH